MAYTGFNFAGGFSNLDHATKQLFALITPIGKTVVIRFRGDKDDFDLADLGQLHDFSLSLDGLGRHLAVIYTANVTSANTVLGIGGIPGAAGQIANIQAMLNFGVDIISIEMGNEVYSADKANFDFNVYKNGGTAAVDIGFLSLYNLCKTNFPTIPCSIFLAPRPSKYTDGVTNTGINAGSATDNNFNNAAINYINSEATMHASIHIYFSSECPIILTPPSGIVYNPAVDQPSLTTFYNTLLTQTLTPFTLWENTLNYCNTCLAAGKKLSVTEWGYNDYGLIKNSLSTGMFAWLIWCRYGMDSRIWALCQHNGIGGADCMITNSTVYDTGTDTHKARVDYYVYQLYRTISDYTLLPLPLQLNLEGPAGDYYYYYYNVTSTFQQYLTNLFVRDGKKIYSPTNKIYTPAGSASWMAPGTTPSYEIDGYYNNQGTAPQYSFGYVHFQITTGGGGGGPQGNEDDLGPYRFAQDAVILDDQLPAVIPSAKLLMKPNEIVTLCLMLVAILVLVAANKKN